MTDANELLLNHAVESLNNVPSDGGTWADALVIRAIEAIDQYRKHLYGVDTLVWKLETIKKTQHEYSTHDESIKKEKVGDIINPLINKLKGV